MSLIRLGFFHVSVLVLSQAVGNPSSRLSLDFFPNPTNPDDYKTCNNLDDGPSYICDPESILSKSDRQLLTEKLYSLKESTKVACLFDSYSSSSSTNDIDRNRKGVEIGIAIIKSMKNYRSLMHVNRQQHGSSSSSSDKQSFAETYAKSIHNRWGVGDSKCQNGILIFISVHDRVLYISTGATMKKVISDRMISDWMIPVRMAPLLRGKKSKVETDPSPQTKALIRFIHDVSDMTQGYFETPPKNNHHTGSIFSTPKMNALNKNDVSKVEWILGKSPNNYGQSTVYQAYKHWYESQYLFFIPLFGTIGVSTDFLFFSGLLVFMVGSIIWEKRRNNEYLRCRAKLNRIHAKARAQRFDQQQCPICLDDLPELEEMDGNNAGDNIDNNNNSDVNDNEEKYDDSSNNNKNSDNNDNNDELEEDNIDKDPITNPESDSDSDSDDETNDTDRQTVLLACGHRFHERCINEWFDGRRRSEQRCPICRRHWSEFDTDEPDAGDQPANDRPGGDNNDDDDNQDNNDNNDPSQGRDGLRRQREDNDNDDDYVRPFDIDDMTEDSNNQRPVTSAAGIHGDGLRRRGNTNANQNENSNSNDYRNDNDGENKTDDNQDCYPSPSNGFDFTDAFSNAAPLFGRHRRRRWRYGRRFGWTNDRWFLRNDMEFRLRRLQHLHPRHVNSDMVNRWTAPDYDISQEFSQDSQFRSSNPRSHQSSSGSSSSSSLSSSWSSSSSSSFSFGGGSSSGGGGGSW